MSDKLNEVGMDRISSLARYSAYRGYLSLNLRFLARYLIRYPGIGQIFGKFTDFRDIYADFRDVSGFSAGYPDPS